MAANDVDRAGPALGQAQAATETVPDLGREAVLALDEDAAADGAALEDDEPTIVCVHGWMGNSWNWILAALRWKRLGRKRFHFVELPRSGTNRTIEASAATLRDEMRKLAARGVTEVQMVSHSMGGLVCREYLRRRTEDVPRVWCLVMIATPNHGTNLLTQDIRKNPATPLVNARTQMNPQSDFLARLNNAPLPKGTKLHCIWMEDDGIVVPARSCVLEGATNHQLPKSLNIPHIQLMMSQEVFNLTYDILEGRPPAGTGPQR